MSLRSFEEQLRAEERGEADFRRRLGKAGEAFDRMTREEVLVAVPCELHKAEVGDYCGQGRPSSTLGPFVCIGRRIAAARARVS